MPAECNRIVSRADTHGVVKHRLFRHHVEPDGGRKDMSKVGRPLNKMILLDTLEDPKNGNLLRIEAWRGSQGDAQLA